jgi:hypothetical protein
MEPDMSRVLRPGAAGRWRPPLNFTPASFFRKQLSGSTPLAASRALAYKLANQANYGNPNYSYNGEAGPSFYGYAGLGYNGGVQGQSASIGLTNDSSPLYVAQPGQATTKIWVDEMGNESEVTTEPKRVELMEELAAVPLPNVALVPIGNLASEGTDRVICIWDPINDKLYEMIGFHYFTEGPHQGEPCIGNGVVIHEVSKWLGVCPGNGLEPNGHEVSASGLSMCSRLITIQDVIEVLRTASGGGVPSIKHVIGVTVPVSTGGFVAPAISADSHGAYTNTHKFLEDGKTENGAYGNVDEVPEGMLVTVPWESRASEHELTDPMQVALYEGCRKYGWLVTDHGSQVAFQMEDPRTLPSPYSWAAVSPFRVSASQPKIVQEAYEKFVNELCKIPVGLQDATLPVLERKLGSEKTPNADASMVFKLWEKIGRELHQVEPFAV